MNCPILPGSQFLDEYNEVFGNEPDAPVICDQCHERIQPYVCCDTFEGTLCENCANVRMDELWRDAKKFAKSNCQIKDELPEYDSENEFSCTPEEYEWGDKISNTPNSYLANCRHNFSNYDNLCLQFDNDTWAGKCLYHAVRERIKRLILRKLWEEQTSIAERLDPMGMVS